jgi:hypothetical protein
MMRNKKKPPRGTSTSRATPKEERNNIMRSTKEGTVQARDHQIKELVDTTKRISRTSTRIHTIKEEANSMVEVRAAAITSSSKTPATRINNKTEVNTTLLRAMDLKRPKEAPEPKERRMTTKAVISIRYQIRYVTSQILGRS